MVTEDQRSFTEEKYSVVPKANMKKQVITLLRKWIQFKAPVGFWHRIIREKKIFFFLKLPRLNSLHSSEAAAISDE